MSEREDNPDTDAEQRRIAKLENFLRPLEKQSKEELDRMFEKAKEWIASEAETINELKRQTEPKKPQDK